MVICNTIRYVQTNSHPKTHQHFIQTHQIYNRTDASGLSYKITHARYNTMNKIHFLTMRSKFNFPSHLTPRTIYSSHSLTFPLQMHYLTKMRYQHEFFFTHFAICILFSIMNQQLDTAGCHLPEKIILGLRICYCPRR